MALPLCSPPFTPHIHWRKSCTKEFKAVAIPITDCRDCSVG